MVSIQQEHLQASPVKNTNYEQYIYLNSLEDTHFFSHIIYNKKKYISSLAHQIYNVLINYNGIKDPKETVIIHEVDYEDIVVIQHNDNKNKLLYNKEELKKPFKKIYETKYTGDRAVIRYFYDVNGYDLIKVTNIHIDTKKNKNIIINNIHSVITTKSLT